MEKPVSIYSISIKKNIMVLTRGEKERLVLELHNRRTPIRIIAKEAGMSFRDIGFIVDKAEKEKEAKEGDARHSLLSTKAYKLFSQDMPPVEVAIELNIREPDVTQYYKEYCKLKNLGNVYQIYRETGDDISFVVELFRSIQAAGFSVQHVLRLLRITKQDLPRLERIHDNLKSDVTSLEAKKQNLPRIIQDYSSQITALGKRFDYYTLACQEEGAKLNELEQKKIKLTAFVRHFEKNNQEYMKIRKAVEEKVRAMLSNSKNLLRYSVLCVTEAIKYNSDNNYRYLPYYGYGSGMYQQEQYLSREEYVAMLVEEADKLYEKLVEELVNQTINDFKPHSQTSSSPALQLPSDEGSSSKGE